MLKRLLLPLFLLPLFVVQAKNIYVDANAGKGGDGSKSSPFNSVQQAADRVEPGDTVIINPGVYFETVRLKRFGTKDAPVTFKADKVKKRRVIITGADKAVRLKEKKWTLHDKKSSTYFVKAQNTNPPRVLYSEVDLFPYKTLKGLMTFEVRPGVPGPRHGFYFRKSDGKLFVRLRPDGKYGSTDPNEHIMAIAPSRVQGMDAEKEDSRSYNFGILGKPHQSLNVIIDGITFETPASSAVYICGNDVTVKNCLFLGCMAGGVSGRYIGEQKSNRIKDASSNIAVENCEWHNFPIYDDVAELIQLVKSGKIVIKNPKDQRFHYWVHKSSANGALVYYETGIIRNIGRNWTLKNCYIHDVFDGIANMNWAENTVIEGNLFKKCIDNAIETENHSRNCHIRLNRCEDIFQSFSYQPLGGTPWAGPVYIYRNLTCRTADNIFKTGSSSTFKIGVVSKQAKNRLNVKRTDLDNYDWINVTIPGIYVFNNTFIEPGIHLVGALEGTQQKLKNVFFSNNIAVSSALSYNLRRPGDGGVKSYNYSNNIFALTSKAYPLFDTVKSQVIREPEKVLPGWKDNSFVPAEFTPAVKVDGAPVQFKYVGALQSADEKIAENYGIIEDDVPESVPVLKKVVKAVPEVKSPAVKTVSGKSVRLEWNSSNDTATAWEVRFDSKKIEEKAKFPANCGYAVKAVDASGKSALLDTLPIAVPEKNDVLLRFTVPAGTRELYLVPAAEKIQPADSRSVGNLLSGVLDNARNWKVKGGITVTKTPAGILLSAQKIEPVTAYVDKAIPAEARGKYAALDLDVQSKSPLTYGSFIRVAQLDKNNRILSESVTDPRWISHMRPAGVKSCYRAKGVIHPQAAKLRLEITMRNKDSIYDNFGRVIKDRSSVLAKMEISRAALRCANDMVFPRYNDANFSAGVSGREGDFALVMHDSTAFTHVTTSWATWGEDKQIRDASEWFWPNDDATVECYFKPAEQSGKVVLFDASNIRNSINGQYQKVRNNLFTLTWDPAKKRASLMLKDGKDKVHKGIFKFDMAAGTWNHVACQWSKEGISVYLNGRQVFAKKVEVAPIDLKKVKYPSAWMAQNFSVGATVQVARGRWLRMNETPKFKGGIDLLRISSKVRYDGNFTPSKQFNVDSFTRALYGFDRTFNGVSGGGVQKMLGTYDSVSNILDSKIECGKEKISYFAENLEPGVDPDKAVSRLNYPVLPTMYEAQSARKTVQKSFEMTPGKCVELDIADTPYMDYVEIGPVKRTVKHPIVINDGEIDCRSFGDIARSLNVSNLPELEKIYRIFNFMIYASDYFTSHQIDFPADSDIAARSQSMALTMLNIYCGFNCGPLNDMLANIFSCSAGFPATRTFGFGHSFQQVFYGGKNRLYDLSAQRFFPKESLEEAASLEDAEFSPNILRAIGTSTDPRRHTFGPDHYIRLTTKMKVLQEPGFQQRVAYDLRPGEKMRIYFNNAGIFNDLQSFMFKSYFRDFKIIKDFSEAPDSKSVLIDMNKKVRNRARLAVYKSQRIFPHYSNAFLMFDGKVDKNNPAFGKFTSDSFCYRINLPYTITGAVYKATSNGKAVPLSISTDGGKTYHALELDGDGFARLDYEVRARHGYWLKIEKNIKEVDNFSAITAMMLNSRVQTGKLKQGKNTLRYEADSTEPVKVTLQYRVNDGKIIFSGGAYSGSIPGNERQLALVEPGKSVEIKVSGAGNNAKVRTFGPIEARYASGTLTVTAKDIKEPSFGAVILQDGERKKELTVMVAADARLVTAEDAVVPAGSAKIMPPRGERLQKSLAAYNSKAKAKLNFAPLKGGKYNVWMLLRIQNVGSRMPAARFTAQNGTVIDVGRTVNNGCDLYKSQFGKGTFGRYHWDYAMKLTRGNAFYDVPLSYELPSGCSSLEMSVIRPIKFEFAGLLILPVPPREFTTQMTKVLSGLNCEPWKIADDGIPFIENFVSGAGPVK